MVILEDLYIATFSVVVVVEALKKRFPSFDIAKMEVSQGFHSSSKYLAGGFRLTKTELTAYAIISFLVILWCNYKWSRRRFEKLAARMTGPPAYPIIGSGLQFIGTPQQVMERIIKLYDTFGPEPFKIWLGTSLGVTINKPEDVQIVLNSSKALAKDPFYKFFRNTVGEGLFSAPVDKWRRHRRIITPVFNANLLEQFFPVFNEKNKILIRNLKKEIGKSEPFDLWDYIADTTLDIICQTALGYNLDTQSNSESEFAEALTKASELDSMRIYKPWLYPDIIFSIYVKLTGLHNIYKTLHKLPIQVISEMKKVYAQNKKAKLASVIDVSCDEEKRLKVFLDTLLELNETGANFSDAEIRDEVVTMMIGGSETSAITNCFCLLMLAIHPDIQDKVYDEIYNVLGDGDETITIEDTTKLVYLEQVLRETLRLYPVGPLLLRQLQDDVKIISGNHVLPKGTTCIISPMATHHLPELYPNPWSFNPDNFDPENINKRHKFSFIAFSGGPRGCIGSKYAMLSMKVLISTFLRNYSVHTVTKLNDIKLKLDLLMRSVHGYPVTIQPRDRRPTYKRN
ncbi:Cytochrome P450, E-class, group I,Cytochrome P450,Cytochrome P450, conserved site [Cinara cedri]|uniref:Cytochrome P450, E-class, group I,Cytochrome P450,Cytochrome P450, conserved site n=1 Tax=Cinara cedri TaxID=506608 RepID=A0A5E4NFI9_9HEMI|nr:Cytochrome P450, E-class, group I,Cytochrome P450,Cytochrome P450, conserved site [Cinara cedri]